jgi:APA family basic amino acid/polyamine antiporter
VSEAAKADARTGADRAAPSLNRSLSLFTTSMLVVGGIIGAGIFFTPSEIARQLPSTGWIVGIWAAGGIVAVAGALTYAELGAMLPESGGPYVYIREAFGSLPSFLCGWMTVTCIAPAAIAAVAVSFTGYVANLIGVGSLPPLVVGTLTITAVTVTNYVGIRPGAALQNALTLSKITALLGLIVVGMLLWTHVPPPSPVTAPTPPASLPVGLAAAFVPVLFSIGGWQQMNMVAAEVRDPERTIPRALIIGVTIVLVCYVGVNVVCLHVLGRDGVAASRAVAAETATLLGGAIGGTLIGLAATLSLLGVLTVMLLTNSRVLYALARDSGFVPAAGEVHPRFGTPHLALAMLGGWSVLLLLLFRGDVGKLLNAVVFADWIFFAMGGASVFALRRQRPAALRPYRVWGYPVMPAFFVLAAVIAVTSSVVSSGRVSLVGIGLLAAGAMVWWRKPRLPSHSKSRRSLRI